MARVDAPRASQGAPAAVGRDDLAAEQGQAGRGRAPMILVILHVVYTLAYAVGSEGSGFTPCFFVDRCLRGSDGVQV